MYRIIILALLLFPIALAQQRDISDEDLADIVASIEPAELGIAEVRNDNVIVSQVGTRVEFQHETTELAIRDALRKFESGTAYENLLDILRGLRSGSEESTAVSRSVRVYEIVPIYENVDFTVYRSKKVLGIAEPNVAIIEVLHEQVASNLSDLYFPDAQPTVISEEPLTLLWEGNVTYYINGLILGDEGTAVFSIKQVPGSAAGQAENEITGQAATTPGAAFLEQKISQLGFEFSNKIIFISLLGGILLAAGVVAMELEGRRAFEPVKNVCRDCEALARVGFKNKAIIDSYIKDCFDQGYHPDDIRISLLRAGWDRKTVRTLIRKYR